MTSAIEQTAVSSSPPKPRRTMLGMLITVQFLVMLDSSIVNVALPAIQDHFGLPITVLPWIVNAYFLAFGGLLLIAGRASDVFGARRVFLIGAVLILAATVLAGFAPTSAVLICARAAQGAGAALLSTSALSLLLTQFPGEHRAKAMGAWGAASAAGGAAGVAVGGLVTSALGWQWVFFVSIPVIVGAFIIGRAVLPQSARAATRPRFDVTGAGAVTGAAIALIYAVLSAAENGWAAVPTLVSAGSSLLLIAVFVAIERRAVDPIIPLRIFRSRAVSVGVVVGVLGGAARVSTFFLTALFLQQMLLLDPGIAGLAMVPTSVAGFTVSLLLLPRLLRRLGAPSTLLTGLILLAAGHIWLSRLSSDANYSFEVLPGLLLAAAGVALSFTPSTMVIASGIPTGLTGLASGLANSSSQIGGAIGIAAFSSAAAIANVLGQSPTSGFHAAFTSSGVVALAAAALVFVTLTLPVIRNRRASVLP